MLKKCLRISISLFLCVFAVTSLSSCSHKTKSADKESVHVVDEKAQKIYTKKGLKKYKAYVEENGYTLVIDSEKNGATPLLLAIGQGNVEDIQFFLNHGASLDELDSTGRNFLDYAFEDAGGNPELLRTLIASGKIQWNSTEFGGIIPSVRFVTSCHDFDIVKLAIDAAPDKNWKDNKGKSLVMYAAQSNVDVRTVKYFLDEGVTASEKNINEWSAAMYAARYNPNPAVLEDLILRQADISPNSVGLTLTMLAACNPNPGVLFTLLEYVDEVNSATNQGKTALMYACENKRPSPVLKLLIDAGADIQARDENGKTALMYAVQNYKDVEPVYFLIASGADTIAKDNSDNYVKDYFALNTALKDTDLKNALDISHPASITVQDADVDTEDSSESEADSAMPVETEMEAGEPSEPRSGTVDPVGTEAPDDNTDDNNAEIAADDSAAQQ